VGAAIVVGFPNRWAVVVRVVAYGAEVSDANAKGIKGHYFLSSHGMPQ